MDRQLPPEKHFYLKSGKSLSNMNDLIEALKAIDDETFSFHVSAEKNDFAVWIKDCFEHGELAKEISTLQKKEDILRELQKELVRFNAKKLLTPTTKLTDADLQPGLAELHSRVSQVLDKEAQLEEREFSLRRKMDSLQRIVNRDFMHGILAGLSVTAVVLFVFVAFR